MDYWEVFDASSSISDQLNFIDFVELKGLKGKTSTDRIANLIMSEYVLKGNFDEFMNTVEDYESHEVRQKEVLRALHNYLASVYTFIEHTHALRNSLQNEKLENDFQEELENKDLKKKSSFMKSLRNYTQHYSLPFIKSGLNTRVILDKDSLEEYDGWNKQDLKILKELGDKIRLDELLKDYQYSVERFYENFYSNLAKLISNELVESELGQSYYDNSLTRDVTDKDRKMIDKDTLEKL